MLFNASVSSGSHLATEFYSWRGYRCAYEVWSPGDAASTADTVPLLLIHPIGVGLSRRFWDRFIQAWRAAEPHALIYNPDLLGCGDSDMPPVAYRTEDWADQLWQFLQTVIQKPVIVVVQGALFPVALALSERADANWLRGLVLSGPPAWPVMTKPAAAWQQRLSWNLFASPLGQGFYQYAKRRAFIQNFSIRQLFADAKDVDAEWLDRLASDAQTTASRYAVFSFLAGFWRQDYTTAIAELPVPTLVVLGTTASSISRSGKSETPEQRMADYLKHLPHGQGVQIPGRNVLPYEATTEFVEAIRPFVQSVSSS